MSMNSMDIKEVILKEVDNLNNFLSQKDTKSNRNKKITLDKSIDLLTNEDDDYITKHFISTYNIIIERNEAHKIALENIKNNISVDTSQRVLKTNNETLILQSLFSTIMNIFGEDILK